MKCMDYDPSEHKNPPQKLNLPPLDDKWFESIKWTKACMECKEKEGGKCTSRSCAEGVYDPWGDPFPLSLWHPGGNDVDKYLLKKAKEKGCVDTKAESPNSKETAFATKDDWSIKPLPNRYSDFIIDFFVSEEMELLLKFGFKPTSMEEKWFVYYDAGKLYCYRSWSGRCYYMVTLQPNSTKQLVRAFSYKDSMSKDHQEFAKDILSNLLPKIARNNICKLKYIKQNHPRLFDTHAHVVFGVDDGATDLAMSIAMVREAWKQGVTDIVCSSHSWGNMNLYSKHFHELKKKLYELCIPVNLHYGTEIACAKELLPQVIEEIQKCEVLKTLSSKYVMVEFPLDVTTDEMLYCIKQITIQTNTKVILAHAERYKYLPGDLKTLKLLRFMGCLLQINAYSILETENEKVRFFANWLLRKELVSFVGSDMHQTNHRPPKVKSGIDFIYQSCNQDYANAICFKNAEEMLYMR